MELVKHEIFRKRWFLFVQVGLLFVLHSESSYAHGGDSGADKKKVKSPSHLVSRQPASQLASLSHQELLKIMSQEKSPGDVAIIHCKLNSYVNCRGLDIALFDMDGNQIVKANTGSEGMVGFEGLKEGRKYEVKIQANKYKGSTVIISGGAWSLNGDRISD